MLGKSVHFCFGCTVHIIIWYKNVCISIDDIKKKKIMQLKFNQSVSYSFERITSHMIFCELYEHINFDMLT